MKNLQAQFHSWIIDRAIRGIMDTPTLMHAKKKEERNQLSHENKFVPYMITEYLYIVVKV